ncbi:MAG TPA: nucleotidyltransferase domain-containing protein, partial [Lysobacter sp.]|nr:nucleotidyltransferase domain-containing protein [Lysobacter sp.]
MSSIPAQGGRAGTDARNHALVGDAGLAAQMRAAVADADAALAARFDRGEDVDALLHARAVAIDAQVQAAWKHCITGEAPLALFAVGGYGRGELFPQSDIDLLVLAEAEAQAAQHDALARFFALLWDAGLPVGHAVRSAADCTEAAAGDITVLTALSEARPLCAGTGAAATLAEAIDARRVWPPHDYFVAKREEQRTRHARFGDTSDNLEPNLKEGPGGLRDVQTLRWMALRMSGARDLAQLIGLGQLGEDEYATLERERRALARLRFGLHLVAGRREERLRFDHQKTLAARLGHVDDADNLAVEQMMQGFY